MVLGARGSGSSLSAQASWGWGWGFCPLPPEDSGPEGWQILAVHRQEKQGSEQLSDLPRVTQLASGRSGTRQPLAIPGGTSPCTFQYKVLHQGLWNPDGIPGREAQVGLG